MFDFIIENDAKIAVIAALSMILLTIGLNYPYVVIALQVALILSAIWLLKEVFLPGFNIREMFPSIFEQKKEKE